MSGAAKLGVAAGLLMVAASAAPQPLGLGVFWAVAAVYLALTSIVVWRRTRLAFATAAIVAGATFSLLVCALNVAGYRLPSYSGRLPPLPVLWAAPVFALLVAGPVCLFVESRLHSAPYRAWREHMKTQGVWDLICFRDIPDLRRR